MRRIVRILREPECDANVPLPRLSTPGSAGADVFANLPPECRSGGLFVEPMGRVLVPTGFRVEIPPGYELQIRTRSGIALKHGVTVLNSPGTIDSDYRGRIGVLLANFGDKPYSIRHGDRVAQLVFARVLPVSFAAVDALDATVRGDGGFGSTGAN
ncbi:MAG: dUTP diphosphatase [Albidovulum sp.]|nr:dUTP diphosphatase [Albidovulum sp.]